MRYVYILAKAMMLYEWTSNLSLFVFSYCVSVLMRFVRSGNVNIYRGKLNWAGEDGNYWYAEPDGEDNAYNLNFNDEDVNPDDNNNRYNGFSLRCLLFVVRCRSFKTSRRQP